MVNGNTLMSGHTLTLTMNDTSVSHIHALFNQWKSCTYLPSIFYTLNVCFAQFEWNWRSIHGTEMCCFCLVRKMHFLCELRITLKSLIDILYRVNINEKYIGTTMYLTIEIDNIEFGTDCFIKIRKASGFVVIYHREISREIHLFFCHLTGLGLWESIVSYWHFENNVYLIMKYNIWYTYIWKTYIGY